MAKIGGILVNSGSPDTAYLVEYPVQYEPANGVKIIVDGGFIPLPNFKKALDEGGHWLCDSLQLTGILRVTVERCDKTPLIAVDDTSAQLPVIFVWDALINQKWYLALLEKVLVTGALGGPTLTGTVNTIVRGMPSKLRAFRAFRNANGRRFWLLIIPNNPNDPLFDERVLRIDSLADLETKIVRIWARAAFVRLRHPLAILEYLLGSWWMMMIAVLAIASLWLCLSPPYYLAVAPLFYGSSLAWVRRAMRLESERMDSDEREQNRHTAIDFEDPFPHGRTCPREGWLEMFGKAHDMVRRKSAKRVCRWAIMKVEKARKLSPQLLSNAPSRAWRGDWSHWAPVILLAGTVSFLTYSPFRYALAEYVPGPAGVRQQELYYHANDGWRSAFARDSNGVLLVGDHGVLDIWIDTKARTGRRLRVSCAAPSGVESGDSIVPNTKTVDQCELDDTGNLCNAKRADSLICELPADDHLEIGYYLLPSARSAKFTMSTELLTHFNGPLAVAREFVRWDPELGTIASGSLAQEGAKQ